MVSIKVVAINNLLISVHERCLKEGLSADKAKNYAISICSELMANDVEMAYKVMLAFATSDEAFQKAFPNGGPATYKLFVRHMKKCCKVSSLSFTRSKIAIAMFLKTLSLDLKRSDLEKRILDELMFLEAKPVHAACGHL